MQLHGIQAPAAHICFLMSLHSFVAHCIVSHYRSYVLRSLCSGGLYSSACILLTTTCSNRLCQLCFRGGILVQTASARVCVCVGVCVHVCACASVCVCVPLSLSLCVCVCLHSATDPPTTGAHQKLSPTASCSDCRKRPCDDCAGNHAVLCLEMIQCS